MHEVVLLQQLCRSKTAQPLCSNQLQQPPTPPPRLPQEPITLFGEDEGARLDCLKYVLRVRLFKVDSDTMEGQNNDFLCDIDELRKRLKRWRRKRSLQFGIFINTMNFKPLVCNF
ncbi:putative pre-mRNA-splicing factor 18 [Sesbania bispinosa]|nr:putative pre-mRNA-splicing factor 18 [Sesbania bispinosa]